MQSTKLWRELEFLNFFWRIWYSLLVQAYFYLNMTGVIAPGGTFTGIVAGLVWMRANLLGGYLVMSGSGLGVTFFLLRCPANYAGLGAYALAAVGMVVGSLQGAAVVPEQAGATG